MSVETMLTAKGSVGPVLSAHNEVLLWAANSPPA